MARETQTVITLTDDIDATTADGTRTFEVHGVRYEIDLSYDNLTAFDTAFERFTTYARILPTTPAKTVKTASRNARTRTNRDYLATIRAWANANGMYVSDHGRVPQHIQDQYQAASNGATTSA